MNNNPTTTSKTSKARTFSTAFGGPALPPPVKKVKLTPPPTSFTKSHTDLAVPIGKGQEATFSSNSWKSRKVQSPPTHAKIQDKAQKFGASMRKKFVSLDDDKRLRSIAKMKDVADHFEKLNGDILPAKHADKVKTLQAKGVTGKGFRAIEPGLDEATQSQTTAAFHNGFGGKRSGESKQASKDAAEFQYHYLRAQSAMRLKTEHVVAPVDLMGATKGQQHPTHKGITRFKDGGSAHSQADRERAHSWVSTGEAQASTSTGVFKPLAKTLVLAGSHTLDRMSFPLEANNVDNSLFKGMSKQQTGAREVLKQQVNHVADKIRIKTNTQTQKMTDPKQHWDAPASPRRQ